MTQPSFVPITEAAQVRPSMTQPIPTHLTGRPSEMGAPAGPDGAGFGFPGPDQGYALTLAHRLSDRVQLGEGEDDHDVEVGAALIASRRAAMFGRAPSIYDVEVALGIFGFFDSPSAELVAYRRSLFQAVGHSYTVQRRLVDQVPEASLRLSPAEAAERSGAWRDLTGA